MKQEDNQTMRYVSTILNDGEMILSSRKFSFEVVAINVVIMVVYLLAVLISSNFILKSVWQTFLFVQFVTVVVLMIKRYSDENVITNQRIIIKRGFLSRSVQEVMLGKAESITLYQSLLGRIMGYGSVSASGTGLTLVRFGLVDEPQEFRADLVRTLDKR